MIADLSFEYKLLPGHEQKHRFGIPLDEQGLRQKAVCHILPAPKA
jgi:hypothetical protein